MQNEFNHKVESDDPILGFLYLLAKHLKLIFLAAAICGVLAVALSFLIPPQYRAHVTILPSLDTQDQSLLARYGSLVNVPIQGTFTIEDFYPTILKSDALLDPILEADQSIFGPDQSLYDILNISRDNTDSTLAARRLKKVLRESVLSLLADKSTGVMTLSALLPGDPKLSAVLANSLADTLGSFIETFSILKTRDQLQYVQRRVDEVSNELEMAEEDLAAFRETNRVVNTSPQLRMIDARKERHTQALKSVWIELVRQLEIAKVDDHRERFRLDILDRAIPPLHKAKPQRAIMGVIGSILGAMAMCIFIVFREYFLTRPGE